MTPESVGRPKSTLAFGKHSGRHGLKKRYEELGYTLADKEIDKIYERFIKLADKKREIFDNDLLALLDDEKRVVRESYKLESINIMTGEYPIAVVKLKDKAPETAIGNGPVDAAYKAIEKATSISGKLLEYSIKAATIGKDAIGEAFVSVDFNGSIVVGTASSTDVIEASTKAYLDAINKYVSIHKQ
jgi:2-isopropylmalate synthase